jgi:TPR repeat protein
MKLTIISFVTLFLLGCAAAGVPYTNDPMTKLNYAYQLMGTQGRGLAAEKLGLEALSDFEKSKNLYGEAEAHTFLGLFYKNQSYREHEDFYTKHNEYDPTASKSIQHFELAAKAFEKDGDYWGVSKALFSMGNAYLTDNDKVNGCAKFSESLNIYKSDKNVFVGRVHPHNPAFESYEAMVESFIEKHCKIGV